MAATALCSMPANSSNWVTTWAQTRTNALAASAARCNSFVPGLLRASNSSVKAVDKGALTCAKTRRCAPEKSTTTPSTPSSEVPDIRPIKISGMSSHSQTNPLLHTALLNRRRSCECNPVFGGEFGKSLLGRVRQRCGHVFTGNVLWIRVDAVDTVLKVQMRTGRPAGGTYGANVLTLADAFTLAHIDATQVCIHRFVVVAVLEDDDVAIAVLHTGKINHTIADTAHLCAGWGRIVNPFVFLPNMQYGMKTHLEGAGNSGEFQGCSQTGVAQALA